MMENTVLDMEGDEWLSTSYAVPIARLFQNEVMFLLKIMLTKDVC